MAQDTRRVAIMSDESFSEASKSKRAQMKRQLTLDTQAAATRFAEHDTDCNQTLDFEEFLAIQPAIVRDRHSSEEIKAWFDAADRDGNGVLSIDEFFLWSLSNASAKHGAATLAAVFERYDRDGSGYLDAHEFAAAASEMGFGAVAHQIFATLDKNVSGSVSYRELTEKLMQNVHMADAETKRLFTAMLWSWDTGTKEESKSTLDTRRWHLKGDDAESVTTSLRAMLDESGGHVADLLRLFDQDKDTALLIDDIEFHKAMRGRFGFRGSGYILNEIFKKLDSDGSGAIGFDEVRSTARWLTLHPHLSLSLSLSL